METQVKDVNERNEEYRKRRGFSMGLAAFVYVGVVLAATVLFVSFVLSAFPPDAYLSRLVMVLAGFMVGGSMIAFPLALHNWTVEQTHRRVTIGLYFGEMAIIAVNTIVSFTVLLMKNSGLQAPEWVILYEPFSVVSMIYTLAAWGIVFLLDPAHKRKAKDLANQEKFEEKISVRMSQFLDSPEGEDVIQEIAEERAYREFSPERFKPGKKAWGTGKNRRKDDTAPALPSSPAPSLPGPALDPALLDAIVRQLRAKDPVAYAGYSDEQIAEIVSRMYYPVASGPSGPSGNPTNHQ
jgi:hypothetical protein